MLIIIKLQYVKENKMYTTSPRGILEYLSRNHLREVANNAEAYIEFNESDADNPDPQHRGSTGILFQVMSNRLVTDNVNDWINGIDPDLYPKVNDLKNSWESFLLLLPKVKKQWRELRVMTDDDRRDLRKLTGTLKTFMDILHDMVYPEDSSV